MVLIKDLYLIVWVHHVGNIFKYTLKPNKERENKYNVKCFSQVVQNLVYLIEPELNTVMKPKKLSRQAAAFRTQHLTLKQK